MKEKTLKELEKEVNEAVKKHEDALAAVDAKITKQNEIIAAAKEEQEKAYSEADFEKYADEAETIRRAESVLEMCVKMRASVSEKKDTGIDPSTFFREVQKAYDAECADLWKDLAKIADQLEAKYNSIDAKQNKAYALVNTATRLTNDTRGFRIADHYATLQGIKNTIDGIKSIPEMNKKGIRI